MRPKYAEECCSLSSTPKLQMMYRNATHGPRFSSSAGPTGVELAGAIVELAWFGMEKDFRRFNPATAQATLVQSAPRILPTFAESMSVGAETALRKVGVQVLIGKKVGNIDACGVMIGDQRFSARTVLWTAGAAASPAAKWLSASADTVGRINVERGSLYAKSSRYIRD